MDNRGYGDADYGYGNWNSGTSNRGYEGYGYGYGYGYEQDTTGSANYGYGGNSKSWDAPKPTGTNADAVIAKINQRLDMLSQLETGNMQQEDDRLLPFWQALTWCLFATDWIPCLLCDSCRYNSYESYDSRSSLNNRDLYRSGYDYSEEGPDYDNAYGGHYDSSYGNRRDQPQNRARDNFGHRGQNWAREGRNRPMSSSGSGRMGGRWNEPPMGGRGPGASGLSRLPSLLSQNIFPELSMFQGMRGFSGNKRFRGGGVIGGFVKQRIKRGRMRDNVKKKKGKGNVTGKKRKQSTTSTDGPEEKQAKLDQSEETEDETEKDKEKPAEGEEAENKDAKTDTEGKEEGKGDEEKDDASDNPDKKAALTIQEEISQIKRKLQANKKTQERQKKRQRDRTVERIQFVCSLCKYRTFYEDEIKAHLDSKFHKEHFRFIGTKLPKQTADFLQEYVTNKASKTEERRKTVKDINAVIQQIHKDQDLTQDIGMEHFVKKVEAAHCAACDLFIPMQFGILQKHLKTAEHNRNRRVMMEQSKKTSLGVARSILNNRQISKKLEKYLKGENPFTDDPDEKEPEEGDGAAAAANDEAEEGTEGQGEDVGTAEGLDESKEEENKTETAESEAKEHEDDDEVEVPTEEKAEETLLAAEDEDKTLELDEGEEAGEEEGIPMGEEGDLLE
nr:PREDICTED: A-kinase anchor protein 8-like isoform X2 [Latimeria chalumnae]|eukprot:XP_014350046.1 PREDICTED: A-kinase anchor protein 8-like isoform X2 [Latimeria chalumnae]